MPITIPKGTNKKGKRLTMGMAASQARFLGLTDRDHAISRELQHLSIEKMALTRDMQAVTRDYQTALTSKTMKWSTNSGVSYTDLSYSTLMKPNAYNMKSPVLVSDSSGKIVLNKEYQKYAEMLDDAGGDWSKVRSKVLSELTGIPAENIDIENRLFETSSTAATTYEKAREDYDKWKRLETSSRGGGADYLTSDNLAKYLGSYNNVDLAALYKQGEKDLNYNIKSEEDLKNLANAIYDNMSQYFLDDEEYLGVKDNAAFKKACCEDFVAYYKSLMTTSVSNADTLCEAQGISYVPIKLGSATIGYTGWQLNIKKAFDYIMDSYKGTSGKSSTTQKKTYAFRDTNSSQWKDWYQELKTKKEAMDNAKTGYDSSVDDLNQALTADQETKIKYYDLLFQAVADNGWTYDGQINDTEYLNQMFQNNAYCVTTVTENECYDDKQNPSIRNYKYEYDTNIASNFDNIITVNDTDARNEALVEYEFKKQVINNKEAKIDTRMKNLETEKAAIKKMMESIQNIGKDNIERTYKIWA